MSESENTVRNFTVQDDEREVRLDHFLVAHCEDFTRSRLQKAIDKGAALVNGRERPSRYRLTPGQEVTFDPPPPPRTDIPAEDLPLNIVYQDEHILVLNKASGMVCHPAPGHWTGTMVNALRFRFDSLPGGDEIRAGLVHRLDKDTSGLMVIALNEQAHVHLSEQLRERTLGRTYECLSWGQWKVDQDKLTGDLGRHPTQRMRMAVVPGGRRAVTRYQVVEDYGFCQLCRVTLETGRTHQIRVHFAFTGHPVIGDALYGDDRRVKQVHPLDRTIAEAMIKNTPRQLLHAVRLELVHPESGETMIFESDFPPDISRVIEGLRKARNG